MGNEKLKTLVKHRTTFSIATLVTLLLLAAVRPAHCAASPTNTFVQDRFVIGMWVAPRTNDHLDDYYRDIAAAHFSVVVGSSGKSLTEHLKRCNKFGLKTLIEAEGPVERFPESPACWGYLLVDEPGCAAFPDIARRAAEIRAKRPGRFGYVNLFPNYASPGALGAPTYDEHVARFMTEVKPEVLSMDHYPLMRPDGDTREAYCENLAVMQKHSLAANIPFWNYFYSMPFNDRMDPTEAQIRWQIFTSVAFGAKGVLYFCYWTPGKGSAGAGEFPKGGAILTAEGLKTRHYDEARRINLELKNYGPTLMKLTSTKTLRVTTGNNEMDLAGTPLRRITSVPGDPQTEFMVGAFSHADGRRAVVIVNQSYSHTAWPTIEFNTDPGKVCEVGKATGKALPVVDDSPELKGLQLSFGAGDARLFILNP